MHICMPDTKNNDEKTTISFMKDSNFSIKKKLGWEVFFDVTEKNGKNLERLSLEVSF